MMKIKNTKLPMKNNNTAKAPLRGARLVCFGAVPGLATRLRPSVNRIEKKN
jgi:hypothetical protein